MDRFEIQRLAQQSGLIERDWTVDGISDHEPGITAFAGLIRAAALEEAAKVCEVLDAGKQPRDQFADGHDCAAAIRALASPPPEGEK